MSERLRPWNRRRQRCERCAARASSTITGVDVVEPAIVFDANGPRLNMDERTRVTQYACAEHHEEMVGQAAQRFDWCSSQPLRTTWRYYLLIEVPWRSLRLDLGRIGRLGWMGQRW